MPDVHHVKLVPTHGDSLLDGKGTGSIDYVNGPQPAILRCGTFPAGPKHLLPTVDTKYVATGKYKDTNQSFQFTVWCTKVAEPTSSFRLGD